MKNTTRHLAGIGTLAIVAALAWGAAPAEARAPRHDRGDSRGGRNSHGSRERHGRHDKPRGSIVVRYSRGRPAFVPTLVPGHYEVRIERVLVSPGHCEKRWVPAVLGGRRPHRGRHDGHPRAPEGHWETVWVPARYEERRVVVWVPGCYSTGPAVRRGPTLSIGGIIRLW